VIRPSNYSDGQRIVELGFNPGLEVSTMSVQNLEQLFIDELKDLYSAEKQITKALPKLAKAATYPQLRQAFENHLQETLGHVERLDQIFEVLGKSSRGKTCHGMQGLLEEGSEVLQDTDKGDVRDSALGRTL
jgi:ferritin-like metal-binding protein YciE